VTAFESFVFAYFNNPTVAQVEWARSKDVDTEAVPLSRRRVRMTRLANDLVTSGAIQRDDTEPQIATRLRETTKDSRHHEVLKAFLDEWGAWALHPEVLTAPFPRDEPALLSQAIYSCLQVLARHPLSEVEDRSSSITTEGELLEVGDLDNTAKYEYCYLLQHCIERLGRELAAEGILNATLDIWRISRQDLLERNPDQWTAVRSSGMENLQLQSEDSHPTPLSLTFPCSRLAPGSADGRIWDGTTDPATDEPLILVTEGLSAGMEWAVILSSGVITANGSANDHCAIVARELAIPCVTSREAVAAAGGFIVAHIGEADNTVTLSAEGSFF
jgi:PEP-utilising enzyme, mobile domain